MSKYWLSKNSTDVVDPNGIKLSPMNFVCFAEKGVNLSSVMQLLDEGFLTTEELYPVCYQSTYERGIARKAGL